MRPYYRLSAALSVVICVFTGCRALLTYSVLVRYSPSGVRSDLLTAFIVAFGPSFHIWFSPDLREWPFSTVAYCAQRQVVFRLRDTERLAPRASFYQPKKQLFVPPVQFEVLHSVKVTFLRRRRPSTNPTLYLIPPPFLIYIYFKDWDIILNIASGCISII